MPTTGRFRCIDRPWSRGRRLAVGEDAAVRGHQPVPAPVGGGGHAHDGLVQVPAAHGAEEGGVAVGEDAAVRGHQPVARRRPERRPPPTTGRAGSGPRPSRRTGHRTRTPRRRRPPASTRRWPGRWPWPRPGGSWWAAPGPAPTEAIRPEAVGEGPSLGAAVPPTDRRHHDQQRGAPSHRRAARTTVPAAGRWRHPRPAATSRHADQVPGSRVVFDRPWGPGLGWPGHGQPLQRLQGVRHPGRGPRRAQRRPVPGHRRRRGPVHRRAEVLVARDMRESGVELSRPSPKASGPRA